MTGFSPSLSVEHASGSMPLDNAAFGLVPIVHATGMPPWRPMTGDRYTLPAGIANSVRSWIGYNVLDWFMRDMTTKELIIMADPNRPRHYEEEFKRQIVQLYENGKPSSQIRAGYGIPRSTLQRWVQGIRNSGSTRAVDNRTPEENELIELRKRNRQLEMEVGVSEQAAPVSARR